MTGGTTRGGRRAVLRRPRRPYGRWSGARLLLPSQIVAAVHRVSRVLETAINPDTAAWTALVGLTAGEGLGFNRAFLLRLQGDRLEGWYGVGPRNREEGATLWSEIHQRGLKPLDEIQRPDDEVVKAERERHAAVLAALSCPLEEAAAMWRRPLVARAGHPISCVRHWLAELASHNLAVIPLVGAGELWGVVLADNFINHKPILPTHLDAASTLAHALRTAVERIELLQRLNQEERRRISAEHATTMLEAARSLAHDLKNPLAVAGGLARELAAAPKRDAASLERQLLAVAAAVRQTEKRLGELVDGLASRAKGIALAPVDACSVVQRVVSAFHPLAASRSIRLHDDVPAGDVIVAAEPSYLERCVENLVGNAIEAVQHAQVPGGCVRVAVCFDDDEARIEVVDNGPPLPLPMRLDPFSGGLSNRERGTGLGLASARRLTDAMDARVEYDEVLPGWVRFTIFVRRWQ